MVIQLTKEDKKSAKNDFLDTFKSYILGPVGGEDEFVKGELGNKYLCGMLFPQNVSRENSNQDDDGNLHSICRMHMKVFLPQLALVFF